ncbi:uncharacterized protein LOC134226806 [Armigeres subalbatus]|uniref:uncharacterized protein LOC134226806 n=1 Tax=Armigeres subalbatus TaxID=124917 RepID=UPI002ED2AB3E
MAQHDTILFVESIEEITAKVQETYASYAERKIAVVPKLVVLGTGIDNIEGRFFVCFSDVCYELPSIARATDVLIKLSVVFGLPYSKVSKLIWHFIANSAYGIERPESYVTIIRLKAYLEATKEQH